VTSNPLGEQRLSPKLSLQLPKTALPEPSRGGQQPVANSVLNTQPAFAFSPSVGGDAPPRRQPTKEKTMKRFCMTAVLAGLAVLAAPAAYAQSAQSAAPAGLEGTWRVEVIASDCAGHDRPPFWAFLTFARGGTMTGTTTNQAFPGTRTPDHGSWTRVGRFAFEARSEAFVLFGAPPAPAPWAHRLTQSITMVAADLFESVATSEFYVASGPLPWPSAPAPPGCARAIGHRMN
jgi:hypothetical protein